MSAILIAETKSFLNLIQKECETTVITAISHLFNRFPNINL